MDFTKQCTTLGVSIPFVKKTGPLSKQMGCYGVQILKTIAEKAKDGQKHATHQVETFNSKIEEERQNLREAYTELPQARRDRTTACNNVKVIET